jgi:hypothetical protein
MKKKPFPSTCSNFDKGIDIARNLENATDEEKKAFNDTCKSKCEGLNYNCAKMIECIIRVQ